MSFYKSTKYQHTFSANDFILDIGASVGLESKKLYDIYGPMKIISVEPNLESIIEIQKLIQENKLENDWFIEQCCIDNICGLKEFGFERNKGMYNRLNGSLDDFNWKTWNYVGVKTVRTKTLEQICPYPAIIKMDIERHEYIVLPKILQSTAKIYFIELHGPCHDLNVKEFLERHITNTNLEITGFYKMDQSQNGNADNAEKIDFDGNLPCGHYLHCIIERKDEN